MTVTEMKNTSEARRERKRGNIISRSIKTSDDVMGQTWEGERERQKVRGREKKVPDDKTAFPYASTRATYSL
jgi:hypothetical protein